MMWILIHVINIGNVFSINECTITDYGWIWSPQVNKKLPFIPEIRKKRLVVHGLHCPHSCNPCWTSFFTCQLPHLLRTWRSVLVLTVITVSSHLTVTKRTKVKKKTMSSKHLVFSSPPCSPPPSNIAYLSTTEEQTPATTHKQYIIKFTEIKPLTRARSMKW